MAIAPSRHVEARSQIPPNPSRNPRAKEASRRTAASSHDSSMTSGGRSHARIDRPSGGRVPTRLSHARLSRSLIADPRAPNRSHSMSCNPLGTRRCMHRCPEEGRHARGIKRKRDM